MKTEILVAGTLGVLIAVGILGVRRYLRKKGEAYNDYYSDFHRHFEKRSPRHSDEEAYFAMQ